MFLEHNSNIVLEIPDIIMLCKHNVPEAYFILEKKIIRERMEKYNYTRVSDFIRDAVLDKRLNQMHARRLRLIGAALGGKIEWLIRFMEEKRSD